MILQIIWFLSLSSVRESRSCVSKNIAPPNEGDDAKK